MPLIWGWDQLRQSGTTGKSISVGSRRERFVKAGRKRDVRLRAGRPGHPCLCVREEKQDVDHRDKPGDDTEVISGSHWPPSIKPPVSFKPLLRLLAINLAAGVAPVLLVGGLL